ncbi:MAG: hypothetical protein GWN71_30725, partial [Gammaproteobacteria bacterium]|nr:hypothetical protein [Gemmatimonadota bacterium]NIR39622.1 hypothetical protein [Actinomycetota bacterium]NIU77769.1 hypothetical protein [Gammaproteobacteria bacterium]
MRSAHLGAGAMLVALVSWAAVACGHDFEPPDRAQRVAAAAEEYSPALFDSITWASQDARMLEGNTIYAEDCRRCHG